MHCKGHQTVKDTVTVGNNKLDKAAKITAKGSSWGTNDVKQNLEAQHKIPPNIVLNLCSRQFHYSKEKKTKWAHQEGAYMVPTGAWTLPDNRMTFPQNLAYTWAKHHHDITHGEKIAMNQLLSCYYYILKLAWICAPVSQRYQINARTEPLSVPKSPTSIPNAGLSPFEDL